MPWDRSLYNNSSSENSLYSIPEELESDNDGSRLYRAYEIINTPEKYFPSIKSLNLYDIKKNSRVELIRKNYLNFCYKNENYRNKKLIVRNFSLKLNAFLAITGRQNSC